MDPANIHPVPDKWGEKGAATFNPYHIPEEFLMEALVSACNKVLKGFLLSSPAFLLLPMNFVFLKKPSDFSFPGVPNRKTLPMKDYKIQKFPRSRIATIDITGIAKRKHHIAGMIELDVTESREKIRRYNHRNPDKISFTGWLISVISATVKSHETAASYLIGKGKRMIFSDVSISLIVEKELNGQKVPIPLVIDRAQECSIESITEQITNARNEKLSPNDIVLQKKITRAENLYYILPGFIRRYFWKFVVRHPKFAFAKMGNVAFTSIGMMGKINGWFIPASIHPLCFGISSVLKKPLVRDNKIEIREVLMMTVLLDHDVMDGAPMARFISELTRNVESGMKLDHSPINTKAPAGNKE